MIYNILNYIYMSATYVHKLQRHIKGHLNTSQKAPYNISVMHIMHDQKWYKF